MMFRSFIRRLTRTSPTTRSPSPSAPENSPSEPIRLALFGTLPIDRWEAKAASTDFPWNAFAAARQYLGADDRRKAVDKWKEIAGSPGLPSRHYLQAWHFLRQQGCAPPQDKSKLLLGVVFEVGMPEGVDLLAAYLDRSARYMNFSGSGVVWERPDASLDRVVISFMAASVQAAPLLEGPQDEAPATPKIGQMSISLLTPSGIYVGRMLGRNAESDPIGRQVVRPATAVMQALIAKAK